MTRIPGVLIATAPLLVLTVLIGYFQRKHHRRRNKKQPPTDAA